MIRCQETEKGGGVLAGTFERDSRVEDRLMHALGKGYYGACLTHRAQCGQRHGQQCGIRTGKRDLRSLSGVITVHRADS